MIKLTNVKKNYDGFSLDVTMELKAGRVTGMVGKNGAGKSTTFKIILGLIQPDEGTATVFEKEAGMLTAEEKKRIGVALAESGFSSYFCVRDIVSIMKNMYENFNEKEFLEQCNRFELPMNKRINQYSTGMKAKLKVLIAMSHQADLLVLDEPTSGLDIVARNDILELLREYMGQDENRSILISSHISSDLETLCDDLYFINQGKIVLHEDTDVLLDYGVMKVGEKEYEQLDKRYIMNVKKEKYGYRCLTREKQFYMENYPGIVIEKGNIDDVMMLMIGGEKA